MPDANLRGATLVPITSGEAAERLMYVVGVQDDIVITGVGEAHFEGLSRLAPGDEVLIDNSVYLAFQTYHRHQVRPRLPGVGPVHGRPGSRSTRSGRT